MNKLKIFVLGVCSLVDRILLEYHIKKSGFTIDKFASAIGCVKSTYYKKVKGISDFTGAEIRKCIDVLDLTEDDVMKIFFNKKVS